MTTHLYLTPVDTFFFRNHMALNAGEDSAAMGLFPPRPGTVYGALRSAYIHQHSDFVSFRNQSDHRVKHWMGSPAKEGKFRLRGVFLHNGAHVLLPLPLDHEIVSDEGNEVAHRLVMQECQSFSTGRVEPMLLGMQSKKTQSAEGGYLVAVDRWKQTVFNRDSIPVQKIQSWVATEPKIGIALNPRTRQAQEHMLYEMDMLRLVEERIGSGELPSLCALVDAAPDFSDVRVMSMGAEQRPWHLKQQTVTVPWLSEAERAQLVAGIEKTGRARLLLLTPTIWEEKWDVEKNRLQFGGLELPIITMVLGRPQLIGGWDLHNNRPKKRSWAIAAGSVFYVEVQPHLANEFVAKTYLQNHSDQLEYEGYGLLMPALI